MIDHNRMFLGDIVDHHEFIDIEFKEFCFKSNLFEMFSKQELKMFITSGRLLRDFNELIINNIKKYIDVYVPRYMSAFHNSSYSNKYRFYIGINDFSEITGVPFNGNLRDYDAFFTSYINKVVKRNVDDQCCMETSFKSYKNIIDKDILSNDYLENILREYEHNLVMYNKKYSEYLVKKKAWITRMYFFKGKLQDVINNQTTKMEFVQFLEKKNLLRSFPEVFWKYHYIPSEDVKYVKNSPNELIYWLIKYKDEKVKYLMHLKPQEPMMPKILNIEYCILTQLSSLRSRLVEQNMNYYTILISFKCNKTCSKLISYKDPRTKEYRTLTRIVDKIENTPRCIDV